MIRWRRISCPVGSTKDNPTPKAANGTICQLASVGSRRASLGFAGPSKSGNGSWGPLIGKREAHSRNRVMPAEAGLTDHTLLVVLI